MAGLNRRQRRAQAARGAGGAARSSAGGHGADLTPVRAALAEGRAEDADRLLAEVLASAPEDGAALRLAGLSAMRRRDHETARRCFARARSAEPGNAGHANNHGLALRGLGRHEEAVEAFRAAVALDAGHAKAWQNMGLALLTLGQRAEAESALRRALELDPGYAGAACHLSQMLRTQQRLDEARLALAAAVKVAPESVPLLAELGSVLDQQRYLERSERVWRRLASLQPRNPQWPAALGHALSGQGRLTEAAAAFERSLTLQPDQADVIASLGELRKMQGRLREGGDLLARALQLRPDLAAAHSNLLVTLNYDERDGERLFAAHRAWARRHADPQPRMEPRPVLAHGGSRLRVGYVSPDFRQHSAVYFAEPLLEAHDRSAFEIHCYSGVMREDEFTARCRELSDGWTRTNELDDDSLARRIADDGIDIVVDLCGHFGGHRLLALARCPAPVQVTWMGYPATTGMSQIGWRMTDAVADPEGEADRQHSERLVRLPQGFLCYRPHGTAPDVAPPPALRSRRPTFGSFNNLAKITDDVVACWARLLQRVPTARLMLKDRGLADEDTRRDYMARFARHGIAADRLDLRGRIENLTGHLALYGEIDVALDPFPYNGTTTTCEALWMGVPAVTLRGTRHAARVGASLLHRVGLDDLIADDEAGLVEIAAGLASDGARLDRLRRTMRERLLSSPLLDRAGFARQVEAAYRAMAGLH